MVKIGLKYIGKGVASMLIGEYDHTLDAKGRVNFPAKLLTDLGESFIITKGLDRCLFVYSLDEWKTLEEKIRALPMTKSRTLQRFLFASAAEVNADRQGRIVIPQKLREYAGLVKDVTIVGVSVRAEIWDKETYDNINEEITPELVQQAMEDLGF